MPGPTPIGMLLWSATGCPPAFTRIAGTVQASMVQKVGEELASPQPATTC
jgi:hypothetical protein